MRTGSWISHTGSKRALDAQFHIQSQFGANFTPPSRNNPSSRPLAPSLAVYAVITPKAAVVCVQWMLQSAVGCGSARYDVHKRLFRANLERDSDPRANTITRRCKSSSVDPLPRHRGMGCKTCPARRGECLCDRLRCLRAAHLLITFGIQFRSKIHSALRPLASSLAVICVQQMHQGSMGSGSAHNDVQKQLKAARLVTLMTIMHALRYSRLKELALNRAYYVHL